MNNENSSKKPTIPEKIELSFRRLPETKVLPSSEVIQMLAESESKIKHMVVVNNDTLDKVRVGRATKHDKYYDFGYSNISRGDLKRNGWNDYECRGAVTLVEDPSIPWNVRQQSTVKQLIPHTVEAKRFDQFSKDLNYLKERVSEFKRRFDKGIVKQGDWFPYFTRGLRYLDRPPSDWNTVFDLIVTVGVPDMAECDRCGDHISMKGLAQHKKRVTCKDKAYRKKLEASGLMLVKHGSKLHILAKRGIVPSELIAIDYDAFVPKWVVSAEEMYEKNKKENGSMYAGMKLDEFISRMRPPDATDDLSAQVEQNSSAV